MAPGFPSLGYDDVNARVRLAYGMLLCADQGSHRHIMFAAHVEH